MENQMIKLKHKSSKNITSSGYLETLSPETCQGKVDCIVLVRTGFS